MKPNHFFASRPIHLSIVNCIFMGLNMFSPMALSQWSDSLDQAWQKTKQTSQALMEEGGELTKRVIDDYFSDSQENSFSDQSQRLADIWQPLLGKLEESAEVRKKMAEAPSFTFWGDDKESLTQDYQQLLTQIIQLLQNPTLENSRQNIQQLKQKVYDLQKQTALLKEQRVVAPLKSNSQTTKDEIDNKITDIQQQIRDYQNQTQLQIQNFRSALKQMGIQLDTKQVEMLLERVDADNIMQMFAVLDILKDVTQQLSQLLNESQEDLTQARRYYGMHLILLETVALMQQNYLNHIQEQYIPSLKNIREKTLGLREQSQQHKQNDNDASRRKVYERNIQAQDLTLKIIKIYIKQLQEQQLKIQTARDNLQKDIDLAQNTYNTVMISAELGHLLQTSIEAFSKLQQIQIPEIIPFENIQMQKKYLELSKKIEGKG